MDPRYANAGMMVNLVALACAVIAYEQFGTVTATILGYVAGWLAAFAGIALAVGWAEGRKARR